MREAFPPSLPLTNNSSGIENHNNNHHTNHTFATASSFANNSQHHKEKDLNIDRNNEIARDISIHETEKICFDSDEGEGLIKYLIHIFFV
jgi:hypothetical protein